MFFIVQGDMFIYIYETLYSKKKLVKPIYISEFSYNAIDFVSCLINNMSEFYEKLTSSAIIHWHYTTANNVLYLRLD